MNLVYDKKIKQLLCPKCRGIADWNTNGDLECSENEVFIAGGGQVYEQALPLVDRIYLTCVHTVVIADTFFPKLDCKMWREVLSTFQEADHDNIFATTFKLLVREIYA